MKNLRKDEGGIKISRGRLKGRPVIFPAVVDLRPTPSRVKEAVFSMLQPLIGTHAFVDLFSGSGSMLIEAWSCGFRPVYAAESHPLARAYLKKNVQELGVDVEVLSNDALFLVSYPYTGTEADDSDDLIRPVVLYADPPYRNLDIMNRVFAGLKGNQTILPGSVLILEHEKGSTIPEDNTFNVIKEKKFGRSLLTMFEF